MTTPPEGIVTEPLSAVVLVAELSRLAPPLLALTTLLTVPKPAGKVSMKLEPVAVLGPLLLITSVKLAVPAADTVLLAAVLTIVSATTGVTLTTAVPVPPVPVLVGGTLTAAVLVMLPLALVLT